VLGRRALVGLMAAIFGFAAMPAASYSTTAAKTKETGAKAENPTKALKACQKDKSSARRSKCVAAAIKKLQEQAAARTHHEQEDGAAKRRHEEDAAAKQRDTTKPSWLCSAEESQCGTIHVLVYTVGGVRRLAEGPPRGPQEHPRLLIGTPGERCGTNAIDMSRNCFFTEEDLLNLVPGSYEVAVVEGFPRPYWVSTRATREKGFGTHVYDSQTVTVSTGQSQEVTLTIRDK
jgi:hypothetical protein